MNHLRSLFYCSLSFLLLISTAHSEVLALATKGELRQINTCRDLQDEANRVWRGTRTFQGFENLQMNTKPYRYTSDGNDRLCQLGYSTKVSPMGKEICKGYLYTDVSNRQIQWNYGYMRTDVIYGPTYSKSDYCRYIN
jgi:hypothetical protein